MLTRPVTPVRPIRSTTAGAYQSCTASLKASKASKYASQVSEAIKGFKVSSCSVSGRHSKGGSLGCGAREGIQKALQRPFKERCLTTF